MIRAIQVILSVVLRLFFIISFSCKGTSYTSFVNRALFKKNENMIKGSNNMQCLKFTQFFPMVNDSGRLVQYDTSVSFLYINKHYKIYRFINISVNEWQELPGKENFLVPLKEKKESMLFISKKGASYGYLFNEKESDKQKTVAVDSMLKEMSMTAARMDIDSVRYAYQLLNSTVSKDGLYLEESYAVSDKKNACIRGQLYLGFSKAINHVDFSFSRTLDSSHKAKLVNFKSVIEPCVYEKIGITTDGFQAVFMINELKFDNEKAITEYFKKAKELYREN